MRSPERADELTLAARMLGADSPEQTLPSVEPCIQNEELAELKRCLSHVLVREELIAYLVDVVRKTRTHESVLVGAGPRATQALLLASRAHAAIEGRDFVTPDDIRAMAPPVLEHRLIVRPEFEIEGLDEREVVVKILGEIQVPR
jgi:MoxR-like ATPase